MRYIKIKGTEEKIPIGNIVCAGRNYADHAKELGNEVPDRPALFIKPVSSVIQSGEKVVHPNYSTNLHHEVELVLLIGKNVRHANDAQAEEAIKAYGIGLDMTLRDLQSQARKEGNPWFISKGFDTSAVLSEFVLKGNYKLTLDETITLSVNGVLRQNEKLNKLLFGPVKLVKYISSLITLEEGDIVFTGTPAGVGKVIPGDKIKGEISGIASVETEIISE
jgi:acylpyruvate hydrolase